MRIGLFLNNLDEEYQLSVFKGIKDEASALGIELICVQGESLPAKPALPGEQQPDLFPSRRIIGADGILFLSSVLFDRENVEFEAEIRKMFENFPFISLGDRLFDYHAIEVSTDKPMRDLMDHLILLHKYKKFLFIGGPAEHPDNIIREKIFREALEKYLPENPLLRGEVFHGNFLEISGMNIIRQYISQHPDDPPDVIMAANDTMAIGARNALMAQQEPRWSKCPVTGFDDISQSGLEVPILTTVRQPLHELGELGVRALRDMIQGKDIPQTYTAEAKLIIRNSCGCPIKSDTRGASLVQFRIIYDLRYLSSLGKSLTAITAYDEMFSPLGDFLTDLNVPLFFLVVYDQPRPDIGQEGNLIYERTPGKERYGFENARKIYAKDFFGELGSYAETSRAWCLKYLRSGTEYLGFVVYEAPDLIHLQICNGLIFLANTVKRLFMEERR